MVSCLDCAVPIKSTQPDRLAREGASRLEISTKVVANPKATRMNMVTDGA